jgi:hypothetical protein
MVLESTVYPSFLSVAGLARVHTAVPCAVADYEFTPDDIRPTQSRNRLLLWQQRRCTMSYGTRRPTPGPAYQRRDEFTCVGRELRKRSGLELQRDKTPAFQRASSSVTLAATIVI